MTSTPVTKDARSVNLNLASLSVNVNSRTDNHFSKMLQKQSQGENTVQANTKDASRPRTRVENAKAEVVKEEKKLSADKMPMEKTTKESEEAIGKAAEELAGQLLVQVANELGISVEEALDLLEGMGMEVMDLLQAENLSQVLLEAVGEEDASVLLTNGELYSSLQNLEEMLKKGMEQIASDNKQEPEQVKKTIFREIQPVDEEIPDVEIMVETEDSGEEQPVIEVKSDVLSEETKASEIMLERSGSDKDNEAKGNGEHNTSNESDSGMFFREIMNRPNVEKLQEVSTTGYFTGDTEMIMNQIMDFMKIQVGEGLSQLEMQLHPESLGTLNIQISSKEGVITAQFTAQTDAVKVALESQMVQLKETFIEQGVKVEAIEVMVESHAFERNMEQGRGEAGEQNSGQAAKTRTRRLNLNDLNEISEQELSEEEKIVAEMMKQNGNTVDYTA